MSNIDNVLVKISKLLKMQEARGATEAEAATAAEHVQRLMQEYNLTLSQVEAAGGSSDSSPKREKTEIRAGAREWQVTLFGAVARTNFCLHHFRMGRKNTKTPSTHIVIGRSVNVSAVRMMFEYLEAAVRQAAKNSGYDAATDRNGWRKFRDGCAGRLAERLELRRAERELDDLKRSQRATGNGTHRELTLSDVYGSEDDLNNDFRNGFPAGTTATKRREGQAREQRRVAQEESLVAAGVDPIVAFYQSHGYGEEKAAALANSWKKSVNQRERGGRGRQQSWTTGDRSWAKHNSPAYKAGQAAGASIGLDEQMGATETKKLR